jgi:FAD:protein FMN transferase
LSLQTGQQLSDQAPWSRRSFLSARGLGACAGGLVSALVPAPPRLPTRSRSGSHNWCFSRRAMGCQFSVLLPPNQPDPTALAQAALDTIDDMDSLLTTYRDDSPMCYVNQHAADGPVRVDHRMYEVLKQAARLTEQTGGAFDASAGALVRIWGFFQGPKRLPTDAERLAAMERVGMHHVIFDDETSSVRYAVPGLEINLGSIGKGYGIDLALQRIQADFDPDCALIEGGRSSMRALGSPTGDPRGWIIGIENPYEGSRQVATVCLRNRALATSSTSNQFFEADGRRYGHLLDPRTGWPPDVLASATVLAPDAATADALSTALFVMGLDKAADFCNNHPDIGALLVLKRAEGDPPDTMPRVVTFNLPPEDVDLTPGSDRRDMSDVGGRT